MSDITAERVKLLRESADDIESEVNNLLNEAAQRGHTKAESKRRLAMECQVRAYALRAWADELEATSLTPRAQHGD